MALFVQQTPRPLSPLRRQGSTRAVAWHFPPPIGFVCTIDRALPRRQLASFVQPASDGNAAMMRHPAATRLASFVQQAILSCHPCEGRGPENRRIAPASLDWLRLYGFSPLTTGHFTLETPPQLASFVRKAVSSPCSRCSPWFNCPFLFLLLPFAFSASLSQLAVRPTVYHYK